MLTSNDPAMQGSGNKAAARQPRQSSDCLDETASVGGYWQAVTGRRLGVETGFKVARHLPQEGEIQF